MRPARTSRPRSAKGEAQDGGFTIVEVMVALGLFSIIVLGIVAMQAAALRVVNSTRARTRATAIANQRVESIRAMPFDNVGVAGPPAGEVSGTLSSISVLAADSRTFQLTTKVTWVDDQQDGQGIDDTSPNDYKMVEIEVDWNGSARPLRLLTYVHPDSATEQPSLPPEVAIVSPTIDGSTFSGDGRVTSGVATITSFGGNQINNVSVQVISFDGTVQVALPPDHVTRTDLPSEAPSFATAITATVDTLSGNFGGSFPDSTNPYTLRYTVDDLLGQKAEDSRQFFVDNNAPTTAPALSASGASGPVDLDWTAAVDGTGISSYRVWRRTLGETSWTLIQTVSVADQSQTAYSTLDVTARQGVVYEYVVDAIDFGGSASAASNVVSASPSSLEVPGLNVPPAWDVGASVGARFDGRSIVLDWTANPARDANGNFTNVDAPPAAYEIERYNGAVSPATTCETVNPVDWSLVGSALPSEVEFIDESVAYDGLYCYRVTPRDGSGDAGASLHVRSRAR